MRWTLWIGLYCGFSLLLVATVQAFAADVTPNVIAEQAHGSGCPAQLSMAYNASWLPYVDVQTQATTASPKNSGVTAQQAGLSHSQGLRHDSTELIAGTDIELLRQVVTTVGSQLVLQYVPENRALQQLKNGQVDLLFAASYTPLRAEYAWFTKPYRHEVNVLLVHQDLSQLYPEISKREAFFQLAQRKLVGTYNPTGFYGDEFELLKQHPQVSKRSLFVFEAQRRTELVLSKRADYTLVDKVATEYQWQQSQYPPPLVLLPFTVNQAAIHVMASKKKVSASCVARLDAAITKILAAASLDKK